MKTLNKEQRLIRWVPTLVILMVLSVMISAGLWQLERARDKQAAARTAQSAGDAIVVNLNIYADTLEAIRFREVAASGHYLSDKQFLLDNQVLLQPGEKRGPVGYDVLTPLQLDSGKTVLVNRGWVPIGASRETLPEVNVANESLVINGILHIPYEGFRLGEMDTGMRWPRVIQYIDFERIGERLNTAVLEGVIILDAEAPNAYQHHWRPVIEGPQKHYSYAVQWFLMSVALIVLAFRLNRNKKTVEK